ncbi:MAG TPA: alpha/beta fold hydrolase [Pyrinomonadaceae bacterium]|nr:alpha/beta fold hydrolase [Pyrinomonadaceae bacterium]
MKLILFAPALLLAAMIHARAQEQATGKFTSYAGDRAIATESYTLAAAPDGSLRAEAEVSPEGGARQKFVTVASRTAPLSLTVEVGGQKIYEAQFTGAGVVKVQQPGRPAGELQTKADVILENLVWHQFHFLLARYDHAKGGRQTFTFFSPSNERDFQIEVERTGTPTYAVAGRQLKTGSYRMTAAGLAIEMWADERRAPLLFRVAAQQLRAVRAGFEGLEKLALAEAAPAPPLKTPDYVAPSSFAESEVTVGEGTLWPVPATLTMPTGAGPHPAVVLVHGSGPNDRDETVGASKPFRDIAWGLASRGVAVLRYDKRTLVHGARIAASKEPFTVKEETVDDALAAAELLRRTPGVDPKRVFVLGHSLGGGLVPRIGQRDPTLRGFVILAGYTREPLGELGRQYEYLFGLDGNVSERERALIDGARRDAARLKELKTADAAAGVTLQGVPASYWLDLRDYSPPAEARKLGRPVLVLHGERDYNVTMDAFADWKRALADSKNVTFKSYPKLDHAFLEGEGPASDADYRRPRNVARQVVEDIAAWLKNN